MTRYICTFAIFASALTAVSATVLVPADLTDLTHAARVIARGEVVAIDARRTDETGTIETIVTLTPHAYLKGSLGEVIRFRVPGGQIGRLRRVFVGAPQFALGEQVVVFLDAVSPAVPAIVGLNQGVFRLLREPNGAVQVMPPPLLRPASGSPVLRGDGRLRPMELAAFEREIRARAQETK
jgi:hypothetical protein